MKNTAALPTVAALAFLAACSACGVPSVEPQDDPRHSCMTDAECEAAWGFDLDEAMRFEPEPVDSLCAPASTDPLCVEVSARLARLRER